MMRARCSIAMMLTVVAALAHPACARQQPAGDALQLYRSGEYESAIAVLRGADDLTARALLVRVLMEVGEYEDAVRTATNGADVASIPLSMARTAGTALLAVGRNAEAEQLFRRAAEGDAPDALQARLDLGLVLWDRGARTEALALFDTFIDEYNGNRARTAEELTAVGEAVARLGVADPQLFHDALKAFEEAAAADAGLAEPRLLTGELFLSKYNSTEAALSFRDVLSQNPRHPRALLGLARARTFDGSDEALALVDSALAVNGNWPLARAYRARLLLGLEAYDDAIAEAERALAVNPASLDALAVLGAAHFLKDDVQAYQDVRRRALALNPVFGGFDGTVADLAVQQRRYQDALRLARAALELDSLDHDVRALTGLTELRVGDPAAARRTLEVAFAGDPFNVWVKNTLDLLDTYPQYRTVATPRFELFMHGDEADLLAIYMSELAEEALDSLSARYGAVPDLPVRVEVYPRHADFSVRTVGLAGLGALGVAFGNILALDSPAAREPGTFNWGSTLWHEIAHAVTLHASGNRVPRWLTEGISVLEERRARSGWGRGVDIGFLVALKQDRLLPASELNNGFVRPTYPEQIMHAYYQASLIAERIEEMRGRNALRDMLRAYGRGHSNEQVFRDVVRMNLSDFDRDFDRWIRARFERQLAALEAPRTRSTQDGVLQLAGPWMQALNSARAALEQDRLDEAQRQAEAAAALIPDYAGADGPYVLLHRIHERRNATDAAIDALTAHLARNETDYAAHEALAQLLEGRGDLRGAATVLERAMYIHPYDPAVHVKLAELYGATRQHERAVRERRAVLALAPVNRADALYQLAVALMAAGRRDEARRTVLEALEVAPNFADAQELLLRLRSGGS